MLHAVDDATRPVWDRLVQAYEYEFSRITGKEPEPDGHIALDTPLGGNVGGWIWWRGGRPAGLAAVVDHGDHREVAEFYVVPRWRGRGQGRRLAAAVFDTHPGKWIVQQLPQARAAQAFWQATLGSLPCRNLSGLSAVDPYWGEVWRHCFEWEPERTGG
jgi:GNAT superfamily N-acetyltransferase